MIAFIIILIIVGNIVIASITSKIASDKGYDSFGWFFLGLAISVTALAIIIIAPDRNKSMYG